MQPGLWQKTGAQAQNQRLFNYNHMDTHLSLGATLSVFSFLHPPPFPSPIRAPAPPATSRSAPACPPCSCLVLCLTFQLLLCVHFFLFALIEVKFIYMKLTTLK